jgi:hypothetical protein
LGERLLRKNNVKEVKTTHKIADKDFDINVEITRKTIKKDFSIEEYVIKNLDPAKPRTDKFKWLKKASEIGKSNYEKLKEKSEIVRDDEKDLNSEEYKLFTNTPKDKVFVNLKENRFHELLELSKYPLGLKKYKDQEEKREIIGAVLKLSDNSKTNRFGDKNFIIEDEELNLEVLVEYSGKIIYKFNSF